MIKCGRKTLEVRIAYPDLDDISVNDHIRFKSGEDGAIVKIIAIRRHKSISEVINKENTSKIAPQVPQAYLRELARELFSESRIKTHGLLVIEFEKL